jgi:hypothetical protein
MPFQEGGLLLLELHFLAIVMFFCRFFGHLLGSLKPAQSDAVSNSFWGHGSVYSFLLPVFVILFFDTAVSRDFITLGYWLYKIQTWDFFMV